jgi:hypothetical protein
MAVHMAPFQQKDSSRKPVAFRLGPGPPSPTGERQPLPSDPALMELAMARAVTPGAQA